MKIESSKKDYLADLKRVLILRSLDDSELGGLLSAADVVSYRDGESIVTEGELSPAFFAVLRGTVNVVVDQNGEKVFICSLGAGEIFGESAMFLNVKRTATVSAAGPALIMRVDRTELMRFIRAQPAGGNKLLLFTIYSLLRKLRGANQELAFERRADMDQADVDALVRDLT